MSLNMYLGETQTQRNSMNAICIETIQGMEKAINAIDSFRGTMLLQGQSYESAKNFMFQTYRPLAQGIIYLCEELIRQNDRYPEEFQSQVAATDVIEQEVMEQIQQLDKLILEMEELSNSVPLIGSTTAILQNLKRTLQDKLNRLYTFNSASSSNYETAMELAKSVATGLAQVQDGNGFNRQNGTFTTHGMNLDWIASIDDIHYTRKANEHYAEYLDDNPNDLEKVITILKYEDLNPQYVRQTDEFLAPLEEQDVVQIKYLMYTAEEPYRTLAMKYMDRFEIISTTESGRFYPSDDAVRFNVNEDRNNNRGEYFTFFHELGHAIDYYYANDNGIEGYYSDSFTSNGKTLADQMYIDVEDRIQSELRNEFIKAKYNDISTENKTNMINNIADNFIYKGPSDNTLTGDEEILYEIIQNQLSNELFSDTHHNASDVYGGVTDNGIVGQWGHREPNYWIYEDSGERNREPNREGFASYYGSIMIENGEFRNEQIESVEEYLSNSKQIMDEIFESMNEGGNE